MFNHYFLLKLIMAPLIIATATLIARRWGENIGGLIVGLPLTSGPVSVFFALEQGQHFAWNAAKGAMLGLIPVAVFCSAYVLSSRRFAWYLSALVGISLYLAAVWGMSAISPGLEIIAILVPCILFLALLLVGKPPADTQKITPPWWDLPVRIIIATTLLIVITTSASYLGPTWSGLLSPFPIFTFVMATFSHSQGGPGAAWRLIRGVLTGLFSYTAFFLVVALLIEKTGLVQVYILATTIALGLNGALLAGLLWRNRLEINKLAGSDPLRVPRH